MSRTGLPNGSLLEGSPPTAGTPGLPSGADAAVDEIRARRLVVLVDDGEQTCFLVMAAERATPQAVSFMDSQARGPLRVCMPPERLEALRIPVEGRAPGGPLLGAPVGLRPSGSALSGASASARSATVRALCDPRTDPSDLAYPGYVYPVGAEPGGAVRRAGPLEAALDLALGADFYPAALVCEILDESGEVARLPVVLRLAAGHGLAVVPVEEAAGLGRGRRLRREVGALLPTRFGEFRAIAYADAAYGQAHLALVAGEPEGKDNVLAYVHAPCLLGDALHSLRCDCGVLLEAAMARVQEEGEGVIVYARAETRRAQALACQTANEALSREREDEEPDGYAVGARIFEELGLRSIRLITERGAG